jgi:hypothetical protein
MSGRSRLRDSGPVVQAGLALLVISCVLLASGVALHSALLRASGAEAAFDGLYYLVGGTLSQLMAWSKRHWLHCIGRRTLSLVACLLAVVFYGAGALTERDPGTGLAQAVAGLVLGPLYFVFNLYWHRRLEAHGDEAHAGFDVDLIIHLMAAVALTLGGAAAWLTANPAWNFGGALVVLVLSALYALYRGWFIVRGMTHRSRNHPGGEIPAHSH